MNYFRNKRQKRKDIKLHPKRMTVVAGLFIAALLVINIISYTGGRTDKNIDRRFIQNIRYQSVYQDSFGGRISEDSQLFMGTRQEILDLRKFVYRSLKEKYGHPKRLWMRKTYVTGNEDDREYGEMLYILEGNNGKIVWDYGEMKKSYSKRIGIDKKIYYFDIRFIPSTIDER